MPQGGYLDQRSARPGSLAIVIALHATAVTALLLSKTEFVQKDIPRFIVKNIENPPPPPPEKPKEEVKQEQPKQKSVIERVPPVIDLPRPTNDVLPEPQPRVIPLPGSSPTGNSVEPTPIPVPEPVPQPKAEPVRRDAQLLGSSELQPDYPAAEERAEKEGSVTVTIVIGTDGRVKSVMKVRAASDAFFRATEQQALRHWRFKPATVDGKPVESRKTMTVHFRLEG